MIAITLGTLARSDLQKFKNNFRGNVGAFSHEYLSRLIKITFMKQIYFPQTQDYVLAKQALFRTGRKPYLCDEDSKHMGIYKSRHTHTEIRSTTHGYVLTHQNIQCLSVVVHERWFAGCK